MAKKEVIERATSLVPWDVNTLVGSAVTWFIDEYDPETCMFKVHTDGDEVIGCSIQMRMGKDDVEDMKEFYEEEIEPRLSGD